MVLFFWELAFQAGVIKSSPRQVLMEDLLRMPVQNQRAGTNLIAPTYVETPLVFVEVDPAHASDEKPEKPAFYSSQSTRAANPNPVPKPESNAPKIEGSQQKVVRTFDTLKPQPDAQPPAPVSSAPVETPKPVAEATPKPKTAPEAGDFETARPAPKAITEKGEANSQAESKQPQVRQRPRTLAQARQMKGIIEGKTMKQDGGVARSAEVALLDVEGKSFGAYDAGVVAAIQSRWYGLLEDRQYALERSGRVVLEFRLQQDGRITDMKVLDNDVGDFWALICQKAVEDPAPYPKWPAEMRREIGRDYREVRFTFHYF